MTTVREVALPLATICTPVPRVGDGICDRCHRPPNPPYTRCWSCERVEGQVSQPCALIVPISLYEVGLQLHYQLKHYKDGDGSKMAWDFLVKTAALRASACNRDSARALVARAIRAPASPWQYAHAAHHSERRRIRATVPARR